MKKVLVAMSGGVDSSVASALLKEQGYDVIGIFMRFSGSDNRCCSSESEVRARLVAKKLNIPFYVFNFKREFKDKVIDCFLKEERAGLTPNPCVVCNKEIKFNLLFKKFPIGKHDFLATGHYARLKNNILFKAKDKDKDQSYFLWRLDSRVLKKTLFPIGDYTKGEIKKLAKKLKLPVADIPESQEICFVNDTVNDFLKKHLKTKPGHVIDTNQNIIGKHEGLWFYTIGQRKGIGLAQGPYYVLRKDMKNNNLIVTKDEDDLLSSKVRFKKANWFVENKFPVKAEAKVRYRHKSSPGIIKDKNHFVFDRPQRAVTPGQSIVFYQKDKLLGGGVIS